MTNFLFIAVIEIQTLFIKNNLLGTWYFYYLIAISEQLIQAFMNFKYKINTICLKLAK